MKSPKKKSMEQIFALMPNLPKDFDKQVNDTALLHSRYLFTHRDKSGTRWGYCTHCNHESNLSYWLKKAYSSEDVENYSKKHGDFGFCPHCHSRVQFKDSGRGRGSLVDEGYVLLAQKTRDKGVFVRAFYVLRSYRSRYKNVKTLYSESYRIYFNTGVARAWKRERNWKYDPLFPNREIFYVGEDELFCWREMSTIPAPRDYTSWDIYNNTYIGFDDEVFGKTNLKYSCVEDYMDYHPYEAPKVTKFLELYVKHPILIERMMKLDLHSLLQERIEESHCRPQVKINWRQEAVHKALGIKKSSLKFMSFKGTEELLKLQFMNRNNISDEYMPWVDRLCVSEIKRVEKLLKYCTVCRLSKYTEKNSINEYYDYIIQCEELGFDLKNKSVLYPKNLRIAHAETTAILHAKRIEEKKAQEKERDKKFSEMYKKLYAKYVYADESFLIRPAKGAAELAQEGMTLSHCVYTNYCDSYLNGRTTILVIRTKDKPDTPFFTLELSKAGTIIQCRGFKNCSPPKEVQSFVDKWFDEKVIGKKKQKVKIA